MGSFTGVIIEESLKDPYILKQFNITATETEPVPKESYMPWLKQWTLHTVEIPESQARDAAESIRPQLIEKVLYQNKWYYDNWYADWKNETHHYIIFPKRIFFIDRRRATEYEEASRYGISLGIPAKQVNFTQDIIK